MRTALALVRAAWLTAISYRMSFIFSVASLLFTVVPLLFVSRALQATMARSIASEGSDYFGFILAGTVILALTGAAMNALPGAVSGGLNNGYLEMLLSLPVSRLSLLVGVSAYPILWSLARGILTIAVGAMLGVRLQVGGVAGAIGLALLLALAYWAIGVLLASLVLVFRTTGPLPTLMVAATALFGGVYYPSDVVPGWLRSFATVVPATYGLRSIRRVLMPHVGDPAIAGDVLALSVMIVALAVIAAIAFVGALRYSRLRGTLSQY